MGCLRNSKADNTCDNITRIDIDVIIIENYTGVWVHAENAQMNNVLLCCAVTPALKIDATKLQLVQLTRITEE